MVKKATPKRNTGITHYNNDKDDQNVPGFQSLKFEVVSTSIICLQTILCPLHAPKVPQPDTELTSVTVPRRVYINREENQQVAKVVQNGLEQDVIRIGSLIFLNVGQLLPHQLQAFHTPNSIYPVSPSSVRCVRIL